MEESYAPAAKGTYKYKYDTYEYVLLIFIPDMCAVATVLVATGVCD